MPKIISTVSELLAEVRSDICLQFQAIQSTYSFLAFDLYT